MKTEKRTLLTSRRRISVPLDRLRSIFSVSALWVRGLFPRHGRQSDASDGAGTGCGGRSGESSFCQTQGKLRSDPTGLFVLPAVFSCREIGISGQEMAVCRPESTHRTGQQSTEQYSRVQHSRVQHSTVEYSTAEYSTVQQNRKSPPFPEGNSGHFFWFMDTAVRSS